MGRLSRGRGIVIQRAGEWERKKVLSAAGDQQALRDLCPFLLNERQRFISLSRGAEKLALYFLSRLCVGYAFPSWIVCPFPSFLKIHFGAIQQQSNHTFTSLSAPPTHAGHSTVVLKPIHPFACPQFLQFLSPRLICWSFAFLISLRFCRDMIRIVEILNLQI